VAKSAFTFRRIDRGWKNLLSAAKQLEADRGMHAKAGIIGEQAREQHPAEEEGKRLTNVQLAAIHEFGVPGRIPARPFILGTFALHRAEYRAQLRALAGTWFHRATSSGKMPLRRALGLLGLKMAADMKSRVVTGAGIPPPNAPSTVRQKRKKGEWNEGGASSGATPRPLVDTGRLVGSITHAVATGKESSSP
jgi:phage gpG-like protein